LEQIRDSQIIRLIERIGEHYRTNISNPYIRPVLLQLPLDKSTWNHIETLTEKYDLFRYHGLDLDEMYRYVASAAKFVSATRREVAPGLRYRVDANTSGSSRVLRDMAVNTFSANLELLAEMLCELYYRLKSLDITFAKDGKPIYEQKPEFDGLDDLLMNG
jgi:hypothetical protein